MSTAAHLPLASTWRISFRCRSALPGVGLIAFCALLFLPGLGARDLTSSHEARAAQNAQMILDEGHWLVPRLFDRHLELQKPPMYYWLVALIAWLKGGPVDVWAVRLPAALSAFACIVFLYLLGLRCNRPLTGLLAACCLGTCLHFTWLARVGRIDMPLTMTITFALGAFHLAKLDGSTQTRQFLWQAFGYVSLGVGVLLKGPIALVLPAVVVGVVWLVRGPRMHWRSTSLWWGLPLLLTIAAPWFVWANVRTDNQLWEVFFWYHNVERGLGGSETLAAHSWWFYFSRMAVDLLPWSLALPVAVYWFIRHREMFTDDLAGLGLIWFVAIAFFLSCMRFKRADYLLPAYPGLAIFLGSCAEHWRRRRSESRAYASGSDWWTNTVYAVFLGILLTYGIGWAVYHTCFLPAEERAWPYRTIAQEIRRRTDAPVIFFRAEAHLLAYHVGQPLDTILEWENLEVWANRPFPVYFVMPEACARDWQQHLTSGSLEEVLRTSAYVHGKRDRPLVVMRSRGKSATIP